MCRSIGIRLKGVFTFMKRILNFIFSFRQFVIQEIQKVSIFEKGVRISFGFYEKKNIVSIYNIFILQKRRQQNA